MAHDCTAVQQLMQLAGIGQTKATAIVAMVDNAHEFDSGRQFAAWLGLVPGQYSSGGKTRLGRITKAGDAYLRSLLVLGARAVLNAAARKTDSLSRWAVKLAQRRGYWRAVVAIAAKTARMAWAVLTKGEAFRLPHSRQDTAMASAHFPTHPPALPTSGKGASRPLSLDEPDQALVRLA